MSEPTVTGPTVNRPTRSQPNTTATEGGGRTILLALGTAPKDGATIAALRLADAAVQRGHRVAVYAYGDGVRVAADDCPTSAYVREVVRTGVEDGQVTWTVDAADPRTSAQVPGVEDGDGSDLWRLVRQADVVLGVTS